MWSTRGGGEEGRKRGEKKKGRRFSLGVDADPGRAGGEKTCHTWGDRMLRRGRISDVKGRGCLPKERNEWQGVGGE